MAITIKIDPVEKFTEADVRNDISLPEQRRSIAEYVQSGIDDAKTQNARVLGRVPPYTVTVDGHAGASLESVNPDGGSIIVEFEIIGDVLIWIARTLEERSPTVSGDYKHGHMLFADGQEVSPSDVVPSAEEYIFINEVPYSRKIEIGKTESGRDFVIQVPNRIYERTAEDAKREFGEVANIRFTYQGMLGGAVGKWSQTASARALARKRRRGNPALHTDWLTRQPAIVVTFKRY